MAPIRGAGADGVLARSVAGPRRPGSALLGRGDGSPLFPFGHGLSYGRFEYTNLTVDHPTTATTWSVTVSVVVTNAGDRSGDEVAQLYLHQCTARLIRPIRELRRGFRRITLAPGEARTSSNSPIGPRECRYWNAAAEGLGAHAATFDVWVGGDFDRVAGDDVRRDRRPPRLSTSGPGGLRPAQSPGHVHRKLI